MSTGVSVVIPTYNRAHYLPEAVASVMAQTAPVDEIIIVDDGSTDDTEAVVRRLDGPIRYYWKPNGGAASARNAGIRMARGKYVALLDTDDRWLPHKNARMVALLDASPEVVLVHGAATLIGADGRPTGVVWSKPDYTGWVRKKLLFANGVNASSVVVRKRILETVGGYDETFPLLENWELWLRVSRYGEFAYVDEPVVQYRVHQGNSIRNLERVAEANAKLVAKHLDPATSHLPARLRRRILAHHHRAMADARTGQHDYPGARVAFVRSLRHHPLQPDVWYRLFRVVSAEAAAAARRRVASRDSG